MPIGSAADLDIRETPGTDFEPIADIGQGTGGEIQVGLVRRGRTLVEGFLEPVRRRGHRYRLVQRGRRPDRWAGRLYVPLPWIDFPGVLLRPLGAGHRERTRDGHY
jgi:hypothetical protein